MNSRRNLRRERSSYFLNIDGKASVRHRARGFTLKDLKKRALKDLNQLFENIKQQDELDKNTERKSFLAKVNNGAYEGKFTSGEWQVHSRLKNLVNEHYILFKQIHEDLELLAEALKIAKLNEKASLVLQLRKDLKKARSREIAHCEKMSLTADGIRQFISTLKGILKFKKTLKWENAS